MPSLAIMLVHNVRVADWRVIITIFGWLGTIGGAFRLLAPQQVTPIGEKVLMQKNCMLFGGVGVIVIGAVLSYVGYVR